MELSKEAKDSSKPLEKLMLGRLSLSAKEAAKSNCSLSLKLPQIDNKINKREKSLVRRVWPVTASAKEPLPSGCSSDERNRQEQLRQPDLRSIETIIKASENLGGGI